MNLPSIDFSTAASAVLTVIGFVSLGFIPLVLLRKKDPAATVAWILVLVFIPVLGVVLFWFFGRDRMRRPLRDRRLRGELVQARIAQHLSASFVPELHVPTLANRPEAQRGVMRVASTLSRMQIVAGNDVRVLVGAGEKIEALLAAIEAAQDHVHLEYYIFRADETGGRVLDALVGAAERGVRVRLLYDAFGSVGLRRHLARLQAAGGHAAPFFPLSLVRRAYTVNLRNHRKLAVIDGTIGLAGGINIGDMFADWRDVHLRVEGPVVSELQAVFLADWYLATRRDLVSPAFFPTVDPRGSSVLQICSPAPTRARRRFTASTSPPSRRPASAST